MSETVTGIAILITSMIIGAIGWWGCWASASTRNWLWLWLSLVLLVVCACLIGLGVDYIDQMP